MAGHSQSGGTGGRGASSTCRVVERPHAPRRHGVTAAVAHVGHREAVLREQLAPLALRPLQVCEREHAAVVEAHRARERLSSTHSQRSSRLTDDHESVATNEIERRGSGAAASATAVGGTAVTLEAATLEAASAKTGRRDDDDDEAGAATTAS